MGLLDAGAGFGILEARGQALEDAAVVVVGIDADARSFASLGVSGRLNAGDPLPKPEPVFPRYVEPEPADADG